MQRMKREGLVLGGEMCVPLYRQIQRTDKVDDENDGVTNDSKISEEVVYI